jgi:hypothetical protein
MKSAVRLKTAIPLSRIALALVLLEPVASAAASGQPSGAKPFA